MTWIFPAPATGSTAAARHFVWSLALSATLALAVLAVVVPSWSCPILPASVVEIGAGMIGDDGQPAPPPGDLIAFERPDVLLSAPDQVKDALPP